jgi:hypothetical protein
MFGYQGGKDGVSVDDDNKVDFESVISNRIRAGVRAGFGGTLKIKYAFGKQTASQKTKEKSMRHPKDEKK